MHNFSIFVWLISWLSDCIHDKNVHTKKCMKYMGASSSYPRGPITDLRKHVHPSREGGDIGLFITLVPKVL